MSREIPTRFDVSFVEGSFHSTDDPEIQLGRVRAFYKYSNRNGSYITDAYAEKLALSAYMKPVFGCYSHEHGDFLGHEGPENVKSYGFVIPGSLKWEDHLDNDGVVRTYATYDVLVWAEYWEEAKYIFQKAQSMEIDKNTVQGEWRFMNNGPMEEFVYTNGVMAGFCVLGDMKTPCFEGAAFFSMDDESYVKFTKAIEKYYSNNGGKNAMNVKVAGLEHEKFDAIFAAINPNFNEEGAYSLNFIPCEIADEYFYALACDKAGKVNKYSYSFNEENELTVELVEETDYQAAVADFEIVKNQLATVQAEFETFKTENATALSEAEGRYNELNTQYEALMGEKSTLATEFENLQTQFNELQAQFNEQQISFNNQAAAIAEKDATIATQSATITDYENKEKDALINKFSACMPSDLIQEIVEKKDTLTINELNTALSIEYTNFSMAKEQKQELRIPNNNPPSDPSKEKLFNILNAYKK